MDIDDFMSRRDIGWYDKQGRPVNMMEWTELTRKDPEYRIVQQTQCTFFWISTVLLGLDHGHGRFLLPPDENYKPVIFETMVFTRWKTTRRSFFGSFKSANCVDENRYCTLAQAKGGHLDAVQKWSGWSGLKNVVAYFLGVLP